MGCLDNMACRMRKATCAATCRYDTQRAPASVGDDGRGVGEGDEAVGLGGGGEALMGGGGEAVGGGGAAAGGGGEAFLGGGGEAMGGGGGGEGGLGLSLSLPPLQRRHTKRTSWMQPCCRTAPSADSRGQLVPVLPPSQQV